MTDFALPDARAELRRRARVALEAGIGQVASAARAGLDATRQLRAQAEPVLSITESAQRELERLSGIERRINDAVAQLEPYATLPEIAPLKSMLEAMKPLLAALTAVENARLVLATLVVPDPIAVGAAGLVVAAREIETQFETALSGALQFVGD
jgi:hypothetical protein